MSISNQNTLKTECLEYYFLLIYVGNDNCIPTLKVANCCSADKELTSINVTLLSAVIRKENYDTITNFCKAHTIHSIDYA